jgi:hypothetical protein
MFVFVNTNATSTQARKPPPAPSARTSTTRQSSVRPARRMSNRPNIFEPTQRAAPVTRVEQALNSKPLAGAVSGSTGSREQGSSVQSNVSRDDIVRAVMPELQVLVQHLVTTSVERALAPLLDKQRELEATIKELRKAPVRSEPTPAVATTHGTAARAVQAQPEVAATRPAPHVVPDIVPQSGATVVARHAPSARSAVTNAATFDTTPLEDIPLELNGGRRRKAILWTIGVAVLLSLAAAVVLSVLSNRGTYL